MGGATVSLFDGQSETSKRRTSKTASRTSSIKPRRTKPHGENPKQPKVARDERERITQAYERGELVFADCSRDFLLCRCSEYEFPHEPHIDELATFELQHYGKR